MRIQFIQDIIDMLRNKCIYADAFLEKKESVQNKKNFNTLILGSSHITSYCDNEDELNMALASQDLYSAYKMYEKLNHTDLKNIIISFSVFTPGHCLIKTNDYQLSVLYKVVFGVDYEYEEVAKQKHLYKNEKQLQRILKCKRYKSKKNAEKDLEHLNDSDFIKQRALKHLKNNKRTPDEMHYLVKLLEDTKNHNQNVAVVIPPYTKEYRDALPSFNEIFEKLFSVCKSFDNVKILNYYDSADFSREEFVDGDHLNNEAWKKLTNVIRESLL